MINTYKTAILPPPVPPRLGQPQTAPVLTPVLNLKSGPSKPVFRCLIGVVVLHLILSFGGFIYLYQSGNKWQDSVSLTDLEKQHLQKLVRKCDQNLQSQPDCRLILNQYSSMTKDSSGQEKVEFLSGKGSLQGTMARMVITKLSTSQYLLWNSEHSLKNNILYNQNNGRLIVKQSGDYLVFSHVTFSNYSTKGLLSNFVKVWEDGKTEKILMKAYCSLVTRPGVCTASQAEVVSLNKGDQLAVWVQDPNMVDYDEGATFFGLYRL